MDGTWGTWSVFTSGFMAGCWFGVAVMVMGFLRLARTRWAQVHADWMWEAGARLRCEATRIENSLEDAETTHVREGR